MVNRAPKQVKILPEDLNPVLVSGFSNTKLNGIYNPVIDIEGDQRNLFYEKFGEINVEQQGVVIASREGVVTHKIVVDNGVWYIIEITTGTKFANKKANSVLPSDLMNNAYKWMENKVINQNAAVNEATEFIKFTKKVAALLVGRHIDEAPYSISISTFASRNFGTRYGVSLSPNGGPKFSRSSEFETVKKILNRAALIRFVEKTKQIDPLTITLPIVSYAALDQLVSDKTFESAAEKWLYAEKSEFDDALREALRVAPILQPKTRAELLRVLKLEKFKESELNNNLYGYLYYVTKIPYYILVNECELKFYQLTSQYLDNEVIFWKADAKSELLSSIDTIIQQAQAQAQAQAAAQAQARAEAEAAAQAADQAAAAAKAAQAADPTQTQPRTKAWFWNGGKTIYKKKKQSKNKKPETLKKRRKNKVSRKSKKK